MEPSRIRLVPYTKTQERGPLSATWGHSKKTAVCKSGSRPSPGANLSAPWVWTSASRTVRDKCVLFQSTVYGTGLKQPERRLSLTDAVLNDKSASLEKPWSGNNNIPQAVRRLYWTLVSLCAPAAGHVPWGLQNLPWAAQTVFPLLVAALFYALLEDAATSQDLAVHGWSPVPQWGQKCPSSPLLKKRACSLFFRKHNLAEHTQISSPFSSFNIMTPAL